MTEHLTSKELACPNHGAFPGGCCPLCGWMPSHSRSLNENPEQLTSNEVVAKWLPHINAWKRGASFDGETAFAEIIKEVGRLQSALENSQQQVELYSSAAKWSCTEPESKEWCAHEFSYVRVNLPFPSPCPWCEIERLRSELRRLSVEPGAHHYKLDMLVSKILETHDRAGVAAVVSPILRELDRAIQAVAPMEQALQQVMARLADLLDEDQFNNIEAIVCEAGVRYPDERNSETKKGNPEDVLDDEYHAEHPPMPCIQPGLHPDKCVEHGTPAQQARNTSG